jgi:hypothetical protein
MSSVIAGMPQMAYGTIYNPAFMVLKNTNAMCILNIKQHTFSDVSTNRLNGLFH